MDISTTISTVKLDNCIYNASGCWCTTEKELNDLVNSSSGAMITKSGTVLSRVGNPTPRLYVDDPYGSINSMGVPNLGYNFYLDYANKIKTKPVILSLIPFSKDDLKTMLSDINKQTRLDDNGKPIKKLVEVNLSCPNLIKKSIVAYDYELFEEYISLIECLSLDNLNVGIKLPPYYQNHEFDKISEIILKYPTIKFITCINSIVNGLIIDIENEQTAIHPKSGYGGVGGIYCKPTALANVNQFYNRLGDKVQIIGCGGVVNGSDIFEHILAGASAVQVGTSIMKNGVEYFDFLINDFKSIMKQKNYNKISDFKGKLSIRLPN